MPVVAPWNPVTHTDDGALKGLDVVGADGERAGSIAEILHPITEKPAARGKHYFLLDPGLMKDGFGGFNQVYLPESAIAAVGTDRVTLSLTAEQIKQRGQEWTVEPTGVRNYRRV